MFFIEALKRRVDERTGGNINTANARTERLICLDILGMVEKEPNDLWRRQINIPVGMQDFREKFANITPHDRELSTRTGIDTRKAVDTIINLLRPDDQRHFKLVTKKAVKCPNVQCQAVRLTKTFTWPTSREAIIFSAIFLCICLCGFVSCADTCSVRLAAGSFCITFRPTIFSVR